MQALCFLLGTRLNMVSRLQELRTLIAWSGSGRARCGVSLVWKVAEPPLERGAFQRGDKKESRL